MASHTPTPEHDPELQEMLQFFQFSHMKDREYTGTVSFVLKYPNGQDSVKTVRVEKGGPVQVMDGPPKDGQVTARASMSRKLFFDVYSGRESAKSSVLTGKVKVDNWAYRELYNFATSFNLTPSKWSEFYEASGVESWYSKHGANNWLQQLVAFLPTPVQCTSSSPRTQPFQLPAGILSPPSIERAYHQRQADLGGLVRRPAQTSPSASGETLPTPEAFLPPWLHFDSRGTSSRSVLQSLAHTSANSGAMHPSSLVMGALHVARRLRKRMLGTSLPSFSTHE